MTTKSRETIKQGSDSDSEPAYCPKCQKIELHAPKGRASRLLRCSACRGTWFPRDEAHLDGVRELLEADDTLRPGSVADARTGLCPFGHGILIRAKVDLDEPFYLERCPECVGIWFDKGEWNKLAQSHLLDHLDDLWDPARRFRLREARQRADQRKHLLRGIGPDLMSQLETLALALKDKAPSVRREAISFFTEQMEHGPG